MSVRGIAAGSLSLIALEVIVTSRQTGRIADLLSIPAAWARLLIDPNVPAIADHSGAADITAKATAKANPAVAGLVGSTPNPVVTTGI